MKGFYEALNALEEEKNIPKEYMLDKIKAAIAATIRRDKNVPQDNVDVEFNEEKGKVRVYIKKDIVEEVLNPGAEISIEEAHKINKKYKVGDVAQIDVDPSDVGRIAAKVGKNVIVQAINEAVNGTIINEFEGKKGSVISGTVRSAGGPGRTAMVEINGHEMPLFAREQIPGEVFQEGQIIKVCINMQDPDVRRGIRSREVLLLSLIHIYLRSKRRRFFGPLKAQSTCRCPRNSITVDIRYCNNGVIKAGADMCSTFINILSVSASFYRCFFCRFLCHYSILPLLFLLICYSL